MRRVARILAGPGMIVAGLNHFRVPRAYERIVPGYLPAPRRLVEISGAAEVIGGLAVMHPRTRALARPWLLALLAAVSPVHLWMLQRPDLYPRIPRPLLWARLGLQPVLGWIVVAGTR